MNAPVRHAGALVASLFAAATPAAGGKAAVEFAAPDDPVYRALYPALDPRTGLTPVAEPAVAAGRGPARGGRERCAAGFRVSEPRVARWTAGGPNLHVAQFLVTTDSPPGVPAPCYQPEPWVCVLETAGEAWRPVDCLRVQGHVFPSEHSIDTAPFRLSDGETAVGARFRREVAGRFADETDEALVLFRFHQRRLAQILAVPIRREETDHVGDESCSREYVLRVESTRTEGFFDWRVATGRRTGRARCAADPDPTGLYRWDGARYVKAR
jgi:hypothetical protein